MPRSRSVLRDRQRRAQLEHLGLHAGGHGDHAPLQQPLARATASHGSPSAETAPAHAGQRVGAPARRAGRRAPAAARPRARRAPPARRRRRAGCPGACGCRSPPRRARPRRASISSGVPRPAASGSPPPSALPQTSRSGRTPSASLIHIEPVRPSPVNTSSTTSSDAPAVALVAQRLAASRRAAATTPPRPCIGSTTTQATLSPKAGTAAPLDQVDGGQPALERLRGRAASRTRRARPATCRGSRRGTRSPRCGRWPAARSSAPARRRRAPVSDHSTRVSPNGRDAGQPLGQADPHRRSGGGRPARAAARRAWARTASTTRGLAWPTAATPKPDDRSR